MVEVKRSPARQSWMLMYGQSCLGTYALKKQAQAQAEALNRKYSQALQALA